MITEDYVSFETAKLLKDKGFDVSVRQYYNEHCGFNNDATKLDWNHQYEYMISAPTLQMAMKWLREKGFHIFVPLEIDYDEDERGHKWYHDAAYYFEIRRVSDGKIMYHNALLYTTPEKACEAAIKYCIKNYI